jgi:putrescine aminotransferase
MSTNRTTAQWQAADAAHFLHPFTDFQALARKGSRIITRAENIYLWDSEGHKILDAMSGLWCVNVGYGQQAADRRGHAAAAGTALLQRVLPDGHAAGHRTGRAAGRGDAAAVQHVFFAGSGSEGNDTVVRMVRRYWDMLGQPERRSSSAATTPTTAARWPAPRSAA